MKHAPRSHQHHDLYRKCRVQDSEISGLLGECGFDVFNLEEVVPEFTTDVGTKKGEKVDFALKIDGKIAILIEAKPISMALGGNQHSQLFRYFSVTDARVAILTNGRDFHFYSDTESSNKMDKKPFLSFDIQNMDDKSIGELEKFHKSSFSIETILESASNQRNVKAASDFLRQQLSNPSDDFVRFISKNFYDGTLTRSAIDTLRPAIKSALDDLIKDRLSKKLNVAFSSNEEKNDASVVEVSTTVRDIVTTETEMQGFMIVRAIIMQVVDIKRIFMRDAKSYCAVLLDDNNRKPICRMYFNSETNLQIGIFDKEKNETRHKLGSLTDIYDLADDLRASSSFLL